MPSKKKKSSGAAGGETSKGSPALDISSSTGGRQHRPGEPSSGQGRGAERASATEATQVQLSEARQRLSQVSRGDGEGSPRRRAVREPPLPPQRGLLGQLWARLQLYKFQFDVTFGLYVLDWWEQYTIYLLVFLLLWFLTYQGYRSFTTLYASFAHHARGLNGERPIINGGGPG